MLRAPLRFAFRRLGARYPRVLLALQFQAAHLVVLGGCALLLLEIEVSTAEFWRIVLVAQVSALVDNALSMRVAFRLVRPADRWLRGDHAPDAAIAAFRALAGLPREYLREHALTTTFLTIIPVAAYVTWEIEEGWFPAFPLLAIAASVVLLYGVLVRFLAVELIMRPVLEKVSADLPPDARLGGSTLPLQRRLLVALPAINVVTGVIVVMIAVPGKGGLAAIGLGVIAAIAVAFTLSFELSLLLARSIAEPLQDLREGADAVARGDLSVHVPVLGTDEAGHLAASFNRMVAGLREREALHDAMAAFVDHQVTHRVIDEGGHDLGGEEVEVTVLFLDIRGFTAFAERASAAEVVARLDGFYALVVPLLVARGGHVNTFLGDGLLAVFGAPSRLPDHADRALEAALDVVTAVRARYGDDLRIGVGLNSGPVVAGTVGGGGRVAYTVIGDAVNTASRVESATRATGDDVLLTEATRALLARDHGPLVPRPSVPLKGKSEEVALFAPVLDEGPAEAAQQPGSVGSVALPSSTVSRL